MPYMIASRWASCSPPSACRPSSGSESARRQARVRIIAGLLQTVRQSARFPKLPHAAPPSTPRGVPLREAEARIVPTVGGAGPQEPIIGSGSTRGRLRSGFVHCLEGDRRIRLRSPGDSRRCIVDERRHTMRISRRELLAGRGRDGRRTGCSRRNTRVPGVCPVSTAAHRRAHLAHGPAGTGRVDSALRPADAAWAGELAISRS